MPLAKSTLGTGMKRGNAFSSAQAQKLGEPPTCTLHLAPRQLTQVQFTLGNHLKVTKERELKGNCDRLVRVDDE